MLPSLLDSKVMNLFPKLPPAILKSLFPKCSRGTSFIQTIEPGRISGMVITNFLFMMLTSNSLKVIAGMAFGSVINYLPMYFCHIGRASSRALA